MSARSGECARVFDRLVEGTETTDDVATAHLRTCLACFRVLTELRDAPRIAAALRAAHATDSDSDGDGALAEPPESFWTALTARTMEAAAAAATPTDWRPRLRRLTRRPAIAAMLGAAAAATLAWSWRTLPAVAPQGLTPAPLAERAAKPAVMTHGARIDAELPEEAMTEAMMTGDVAALGTVELRTLLRALRASEPGDVRSLVDASHDEDSALEPANETGVVEEIAALDGRALQRVARVLAGSAL